MKLLLTTLLLLSIAVGSGEDKAEDSTNAVIAHETFESPRAFKFGEYVYLDIDKDGVDDFQFSTVIVNKEGVIHTKYLVNTLGKNQVLAADNVAAMNEEGMKIAEFGNEAWTSQSGEIIEQVVEGNSSTWTGTWSGDRDQYLGIKLVKEGNEYTGWVNVSIDPAKETAYVHGYAINRNSNSGIAAGQL